MTEPAFEVTVTSAGGENNNCNPLLVVINHPARDDEGGDDHDGDLDGDHDGDLDDGDHDGDGDI